MRILHCTWAVLALLAGRALAQTPEAAQVETGYTLFVRGVPIGREDVSVRRAGDGTTVTSHGNAAAPLNAVWRHVEYRYAPDGSPRAFELDGSLGGVDVELRTTFENGTASTSGTQNKSPVSATQKVSPGSVLLPSGMFSGFVALAQRLTSAREGDEFTTYMLPRFEVQSRVLKVASERMQRGNAFLDVRRYELSFVEPTGDLIIHVTSAPNGDLIRVNVPGQWLDFVRDDVAGAMARTDIYSNPGDVAVTIPALGFNLGATLTVPKDAAAATARRPAVILVPGPDAADRDAIAAGVPALGQLAGALADAGFIAVRYDRRGSGQSGGRAESASLTDYVDDVRTVARWLSDRKDVDDKRIAVLGHETGAWFALLAASREKRIAALVTLAAPASAGGDFALEQQQLQLDRMRLPATDRENRVALQKQLHAAVVSGKGWERIAPELRRQADTPWFQSFLTFDPVRTADGVDAPILLVHGELDREVIPSNAERLATSARKGDAESVDLVVVRGVNHLLQTAVTGDVAEYQTLPDKRVSAEVVSTVVGWLQRTLPPRSR